MINGFVSLKHTILDWRDGDEKKKALLEESRTHAEGQARQHHKITGAKKNDSNLFVLEFFFEHFIEQTNNGMA